MGNSVVGLDIGSTALRGVELSGANKTKPNLLRFFEVPLPPGAVSRGEVVDESAVGLALKKLWSEGGFKSKNVVLGMGNQRVLVRDLSVPKMSLKRIRESLPFQVQSMLQIPPADSLLDFYPISESTGEHGAMINGLLVAAEKSAILGNILAAERAGLTPLEVDLIPFALNRLLLRRSNIKGTVALIDVGGNTTSIIISCDGVPWFVRIIPAGGEDLTQALKSGLEIEADRAEELKRTLRVGAHVATNDDSAFSNSPCTCDRCVADGVNAEDPRAANIVQTVTNELLGSLRNTVNYFNNTRPQDPVSRVLLTGGGARLAGFTEVLAEMTHLSVTEADPLAAITHTRRSKSKKMEENRSSIAVALGLALRGLA
jgi:type IV pilus assembly protein PilM